MEWKLFLTVFGTIFLAEMADKTQFATLLFAADRQVSKFTVFLAATLALAATSAIAVAAGSALSNVVSPRLMSLLAGSGFVLVGILILWQAWTAV
jgi:putative Ca2+/H+ antiporter (TMEM165/GDT1 family)